ncbi:Pregnancy-associated plasma protein-A [Flavobacterium micromati]|uniref:Pregnancy-associated plasma protein-A n=1 Tax=Flavobacterium micromati TaxID=229205 RepID=A0A1M5Q7L0_9FLAO|nr:zinc metalloprotease [Flavobacterium micromati]MCL6461041.1 zinc metalloprotease [Flavobacterium micromati]SHH10154.1 Pregnancy-associated plasma protein-A [Flavobacterium micromati]
MKKIFLSVTAMMLLFSCQNDTTEMAPETSAVLKRGCASSDVLAAQIKADPSLALAMNKIENFTNNAMTSGRLVNGKVQIPVVVNVLYRTASENISLAQIQSQIDVLNRDFNAQNTDFSSVPTLFSTVKANVGISFVLQNVVRRATTVQSWTTNDAMKRSATGITPTTPSTVLNMWACNLGGGILGYAQFPGGASSTDGVVMDNNAFGSTGSVSAPFNLGRTATHEVGHWMNLRHIWGDANCGSDFVSDTPTHNEANYGVPAYPSLSLCTGNPVEMTMNYMDYTDDRGMYMFSNGQKSRMAALFVSGGARANFGI